jgi:hypothetical protein
MHDIDQPTYPRPPRVGARVIRRMKLWPYCLVMRVLWRLGYRLYNWAEDRRPAGGFHPRNM